MKPSDFVITEDGKSQKISVFEFQKLETEPAAATALEPAPAIAVDTPKAAIPAAIAAPPIAPEKPGEIKYRNRRLMVMFFDMTSMPIQDQIRAQTAALKFLRTQMTPSDLMAIMTFSSEVKVVEDFTADRDQLEKDIKKLVSNRSV